MASNCCQTKHEEENVAKKKLRKHRKLNPINPKSSDTDKSDHRIVGDSSALKAQRSGSRRFDNRWFHKTDSTTSQPFFVDDGIINAAKFAVPDSNLIVQRKYKKTVISKQTQVNAMKNRLQTELKSASERKVPLSTHGASNEQTKRHCIDKRSSDSSTDTSSHSFIKRKRKTRKVLRKTTNLLAQVNQTHVLHKTEEPVKPSTPLQMGDNNDCSILMQSKNLQTKPALTNIATLPSESTKACVKYCKIAEQALTTFNNEVSTVLRNSFGDIDKIQLRIRNTIEEISACDRLYEKLKVKSCTEKLCLSAPYISDLENSNEAQKTKDNLIQALAVGLVQTQSENQMRLAILPQRDDSFMENKPSESKPELHIKPDTPPDPPPIIHPPILPKIVAIIEDLNQPCSTLKQQKRDVFNIPLSLNFDKAAPNAPADTTPVPISSHRFPKFCELPESTRKKIMSVVKTLNPNLLAARNRPLTPEIKRKLHEIAATLDPDDLHRIKAHSNLHKKLVREFEATDSLLEFQRRMKRTKRTSKFLKKEIEVVVDVPTKPLKAEELYVPEKINKICPTNVKVESKHDQTKKTTHFFYREKKKAKDILQETKTAKAKNKHKDNSVDKKYPDSLLFSSQDKKAKQSNQAVIATNDLTIVNCGSNYNNVTVQTEKPYKPNIPLVSFKTGLDCFDILDEISLRDLQPIASEYPRKDYIGTEPHYQKVENTYLYKLIYGPTQDHFLQLLRLEEPICPYPNCAKCKSANSVTSTGSNPNDESKDLKQTLNNKINIIQSEKYKKEVFDSKENYNLKKVEKSNKKTKLNKNQSNHSFLCSKSSLFNTIKAGINPKKSLPRQLKIKKTAGDDIITKLKPYMFDPHTRYPTTITVMPVLVTTYTNPNFAVQKPLLEKNQGGDCRLATSSKPVEEAKFTKAVKTPPKKKNKNPKTTSVNLMNYLEKQNLNSQQKHGDSLDNYYYQDFPEPFTPPPPPPPPPTPPPSRPQVAKKTLAQVDPVSPRLKSAKVTKAAATKSKKIQHSQAMLQKHAAESRKLLQDIQKLSQKTKLEANIQNVIDMIETKIVEILSHPDESHNEAFKTVESKIVEILNTMNEEGERLEPIEECGLSSVDLDLKPQSFQFHSKTTGSLLSPKVSLEKLLRSATHPTFIPNEAKQYIQVDFSPPPPDSNKSKRSVTEDLSLNTEPKLSTNNSSQKLGVFTTEALNPEKNKMVLPDSVTITDFKIPPKHILEFLEAITNLSADDSTCLPSLKQQSKVIGISCRFAMAEMLSEIQIFYPLFKYNPVILEKDKVLKKCPNNKVKKMENDLEAVLKNLSPLNLNKFITPTLRESGPLKKPNVICCRFDKIIPRKNASKKIPVRITHRSLGIQSGTNLIHEIIPEEPLTLIVDKDETIYDHNTLLNSVYGMLFSIIFLGLTFNYSCQ